MASTGERGGVGAARRPIAEARLCIAKTQASVTDDPAVRGAPRGFRITVREVRAMAGARLVVPLSGEVETMPGLPRIPLAERLALRADGAVEGLG